MKKNILFYALAISMPAINSNLSAAATTQPAKDAALVAAAEAGNAPKVKELIESGANVNTKDYLGYSGLIWASMVGDKQIAELLINAKADINTRVMGKTPLMFASENGHKKIVQLLLNAKANVLATDRNNDTALMHAVRNARKDIVELLIAAGGYTDKRNGNGRNLIDLAKEDIRTDSFYDRDNEDYDEEQKQKNEQGKIENEIRKEILKLVLAEKKRVEEAHVKRQEIVKKMVSEKLPQVLSDIVTGYAEESIEEVPVSERI